MKPPKRIALHLAATASAAARPTTTLSSSACILRHIHTTPATPATVTSMHSSGPPPEPPRPAADSPAERLERRRKQAELLARAQEIRASQRKTPSSSSPTSSSSKNTKTPLARKRFWKDVHVREVDGAWEVHLDARPLRRPDTKDIVRVPLSKPLLAAALAHEWDSLVSAQQATRQHLIPLTSLACRALDIADSDENHHGGGGYGDSIRAGIARTLMRYLDTDSLLCWAPPPPEIERRLHVSTGEEGEGEGESLRDRQRRAAEKIVGFLTSRVWPGVEIEPVLDGESIVPRSQKESTHQIIEGWIMGLSPWELAGLERGVLAGKGLLGAVRLLVEWTEGFVGTGVGSEAEGAAFGVEEAARLASIEVDWQTGKWGEVEDTHDVEKEDLRRQLGSVVLLVSGTGKKH